MQKGCNKFQISDALDLDRNSYYYNNIIDLTAMEQNNFAYDKVDVCNCCQKDQRCENAGIAREDFIREYFQQFFR